MKKPENFKSKEYEMAWHETEELFESLGKRYPNKSTATNLAKWLLDNNVKKFGTTTICNIRKGRSNAIKAKQLARYLKEYFAFLDQSESVEACEREEKNDHKKKNSSETSQKLALYIRKSFYLYFYDAVKSGEEGVLARAVLHIQDFHSDYELNVKLINSEGGTDYSGTVRLHISQNYLIFLLQTQDTKEKNLHINVIIKPEQVSELAVGVYCNIDDAGALRAGSIILECLDEKEKDNSKPMPLYDYTDEYKALDINIKRFLGKKELNYLKVTKGIFNIKGLESFFSKQEKKTPKLPATAGDVKKVFLAAPMYSLNFSQALAYVTFRREMLQIAAMLERILSSKKQACEVHYVGSERMTESDFFHPSAALKYSVEKLNDTDCFILIYPENLPSSILVEAGWALAKDKSCLFFVHQNAQLPYMLQNASEYAKVRTVKYNHYEEILKFIEKHGKGHLCI